MKPTIAYAPPLIEEAHARYSSQIRAMIATALAVGCGLLMDDLFNDLAAAERDQDAGQIIDVEDTDVLSELPRAWWRQLDAIHIRRLVVTGALLTAQVMSVWRTPVTLAEELLFVFLLERVESVAEKAGFVLPLGWQGDLSDVFLEDNDVFFLLDPTQDGYWDSPAGRHLGVAPQEFKNLFEPYRNARLHPYLRPA